MSRSLAGRLSIRLSVELDSWCSLLDMSEEVVLEQFVSGFKGGQRPLGWSPLLSPEDRGAIYDACWLKESSATSQIDYTGTVSFFRLPSGKMAFTMVFRDSDEAGRSCPLWHTLVLDGRALESIRGNPFVLVRAGLFSPRKDLQNPLPLLETELPPSVELHRRLRLSSLGRETAGLLLDVAFGEKRGFIVSQLAVDDLVEEVLLCLTSMDRPHFTFSTCVFSPEERRVKLAVMPPEAQHNLARDEDAAVLDLTRAPVLARGVRSSKYAAQVCEMIFGDQDISQYLSMLEQHVPLGTLDEKAAWYVIWLWAEKALSSGDVTRCLETAEKVITTRRHESSQFRRIITELYSRAFSSTTSAADFERVLVSVLKLKWENEGEEFRREFGAMIESAMRSAVSRFPESGHSILASQEAWEQAFPGFDVTVRESVVPDILDAVVNATSWATVSNTAVSLLKNTLWEPSTSARMLARLFSRAARDEDERYLSTLLHFVRLSLGETVFADFCEEVVPACFSTRTYPRGFSVMLDAYLGPQVKACAVVTDLVAFLTDLSQQVDFTEKGEDVFLAIGKALDAADKQSLLVEAVWPWLSAAELDKETVRLLSNSVSAGFLRGKSVTHQKFSILESYVSAADASGRVDCAKGAIDRLIGFLEERGDWRRVFYLVKLYRITPWSRPYFSYGDVMRRLRDLAASMERRGADYIDFLEFAGRAAAEMNPETSVLFLQHVRCVGDSNREMFFRFVDYFAANPSRFSSQAHSSLLRELRRIVEASWFRRLSGREKDLLNQIGALDLAGKRRGVWPFGRLHDFLS